MEFALLNVSAEYHEAARNFRREFDIPLVEYDVREGDLPGDFSADAAVVTGSPASVYWDLDWLDPLKAWVSDALDRGVPVLGVCFGHQLLADVLGGTVVGREKYELGYHTLEHSGDSALFKGVPQEFTAFTAHSDDVVDLPLGACKLAENEHSLHAFERGNAMGVQFHAEIDFETAKAFVREREPSGERTPDAVSTLTDENYEKAKETKRIFDNFTEFVRETA